MNDRYTLHHGDCIEYMKEVMEPNSVDMAITSVPFPQIYSYTSLESDIGNSEDLTGEAKVHFSYFFRALCRVLKPGRSAHIHCMQIPKLAKDGERGLFDFRGFLIRLGIRAGLEYSYDYIIRKNPQAQSIRTHSQCLAFAQMERDRYIIRGALGDYVIKFMKPGPNAVPIRGGITRNEWIEFAECCWNDINETDTLNTRAAKSGDDTRHIAPLQLGLINRLIRLYSNSNEIVFDPFNGIGSSGVEAIKLGRRYIGTELKDEYFKVSLKNLDSAVTLSKEKSTSMFDLLEA